jgi:hypothetical protein
MLWTESHWDRLFSVFFPPMFHIHASVAQAMDNRPIKRSQFHRDMVPPHHERITVKNKEDNGFIIS